MRWYDLFAFTYDRQLERLYAPHRRELAARWGDLRGAAVLDVACGTGQSFPFVLEAVSAEGHLMGIDRSRGMLAKARRRVERAGTTEVRNRRATKPVITGTSRAMGANVIK